MGTTLDDLVVVSDHYCVRVLDRRQAVRNDKHRSYQQPALQAFPNKLFSFNIYRRCNLVEDHDLRVVQQQTINSKPSDYIIILERKTFNFTRSNWQNEAEQ